MAQIGPNNDTLTSALERIGYIEDTARESLSLVIQSLESLTGPKGEEGASGSIEPRANGYIGELHQGIGRLERILGDLRANAFRVRDLTRDTRQDALAKQTYERDADVRMTGRAA